MIIIIIGYYFSPCFASTAPPELDTSRSLYVDDPSRVYAKIHGLRDDSTYVISITAQTSVGPGPGKEITETTAEYGGKGTTYLKKFNGNNVRVPGDFYSQLLPTLYPYLNYYECQLFIRIRIITGANVLSAF